MKTTPTETSLPTGLARPALNALAEAGLTGMHQLTGDWEPRLLALHGIGPETIRILRAALAQAQPTPVIFPSITVETVVHAPLSRVWEAWVRPQDICQWNSASPDWHTPSAHSDLRVGGTFTYRMEARDGSAGFDFSGVFTEVQPQLRLAFQLGDQRTVRIVFQPVAGGVLVRETFDAEQENSLELQREGWQAILDHFRRYVEGV